MYFIDSLTLFAFVLTDNCLGLLTAKNNNKTLAKNFISI